MNAVKFFIWTSILLLLSGCWDEPEHELDNDFGNGGVVSSDSGSGDVAGDTGSDVAARPSRNSVLAAGWAGFGASCSDVSQCTGYPSSNKQCLQDVMGLVNCPGGYCTACCNTPGEGICGQGIDCVGAENAYLICLERCETDADCRTEDHYLCHEGLYYMENIFIGKYCLPDMDHITPEPGAGQLVECPWPWL